MYLPRNERFDFLLMAAGDLSRQYRKGKQELYWIAVAQIYAWFMSLTEAFFVEWGGDKIANAIGQKYPADHCGYCGQLPCVCKEEERPKHKLGHSWLAQRDWSIARWQGNLNTLYGKANAEGGVPRALNRLFEETAEVGLLLHLADGFDDSREELEKKIAREMTDVLAWLFAVATLLGVDVQKSVSALYNNFCPVCHSPVCACKSFERRPQSGTLTHRFMPAEEIKALLAA